jgi:hypothetical protein
MVTPTNAFIAANKEGGGKLVEMQRTTLAVKPLAGLCRRLAQTAR